MYASWHVRILVDGHAFKHHCFRHLPPYIVLAQDVLHLRLMAIMVVVALSVVFCVWVMTFARATLIGVHMHALPQSTYNTT
jgi:hypothetical protein